MIAQHSGRTGGMGMKLFGVKQRKSIRPQVDGRTLALAQAKERLLLGIVISFEVLVMNASQSGLEVG